MIKSPVKRYIPDFPSMIASRLKPSEGSNLKDFSLSHNYLREKKDGEAGAVLTYKGVVMRMGYFEEGIWLVLEPDAGFQDLNINKSKLEDLLSSPENLSHNKGMAKFYKKVIPGAKIYSSGERMELSYPVNEGKDRDEIFEAFFFNLKPVLRAIQLFEKE